MSAVTAAQVRAVQTQVTRSRAAAARAQQNAAELRVKMNKVASEVDEETRMFAEFSVSRRGEGLGHFKALPKRLCEEQNNAIP